MSGDNPSMSKALTETVASGGYVVDTAAVAAAMLTRDPIRRAASGVFESAQPVDLASLCIPEDDAAAFGDVA
jgi:hypothetical protein